MLEQLLALPGFVYDLGGSYYYLGKWICKECADPDVTDCVVMYAMCREAKETRETGYYFQKLRVYSDFALEIPYDPERIRSEMDALLAALTDTAADRLAAQIAAFREDFQRYAQA